MLCKEKVGETFIQDQAIQDQTCKEKVGEGRTSLEEGKQADEKGRADPHLNII